MLLDSPRKIRMRPQVIADAPGHLGLAAIEAIALAQAADLREGKEVMGADYRKLHEVVRSVCPRMQGDRPLAEEIGRVTELLQSEEVQERCLAPGEEGKGE